MPGGCRLEVGAAAQSTARTQEEAEDRHGRVARRRKDLRRSGRNRPALPRKPRRTSKLKGLPTGPTATRVPRKEGLGQQPRQGRPGAEARPGDGEQGWKGTRTGGVWTKAGAGPTLLRDALVESSKRVDVTSTHDTSGVKLTLV